MNVGRVSFSMGAGFELHMAGWEGAVQRKRPVHGLTISGDGPGCGTRLLIEEQRVWIVHAQG